MEKQKNGIGRRKAAVTRVFLSKGEGSITVNDKDYKVYFPLVYLQNQVERPLKTVDVLNKFDIKINAAGGGVKGQAEAAMLGIARVLLEINPEFRPALKAAKGCVGLRAPSTRLVKATERNYAAALEKWRAIVHPQEFDAQPA